MAESNEHRRKRLEKEQAQLIMRVAETLTISENDKTATNTVKAQDPSAWKSIEARYPWADLGRLFPESVRAVRRKKLAQFVETTELNADRHLRQLGTFFYVTVPPGGALEELMAELRRARGVELVYRDPEAEPAGGSPAAPATTYDQGYLDASPRGIGAREVRGIAGADGEGQTLLDFELGFELGHEDLRDQFAPHTSNHTTPVAGKLLPEHASHGTSVLGVICACDNGIGVCGITPRLSVIRIGSGEPTNASRTCSQELTECLNALSPGSVLLLELQVSDYRTNGFRHLPLEALAAEHLIVESATMQGVVVVAAAGNGRNDFDNFQWNNHPELVDPLQHDTGAIIVAAGALKDSSDPYSWGRGATTNIGSRIDCFAWGADVATCSSNGGPPFDRYRPDFNCTSAAAAIVAGAALSVQGMATHFLGRRLSPAEMRELLRTQGTESANPNTDKIGVMPDLKKIAEELQKLPAA